MLMKITIPIPPPPSNPFDNLKEKSDAEKEQATCIMCLLKHPLRRKATHIVSKSSQ